MNQIPNTTYASRNTRYEIMQNEPNLNHRHTQYETIYAKRTQFAFENRASRIVHRKYAKRTQFPTHPLQTRHAEPKAKSRRAGAKQTQFHQHHPYAHLAIRITGHWSRVTINENEPNSSLYMCPKHQNTGKFYHVFFAFSLLLFTFFLILLLSFLHFSILFVTFCNFWTLTHLTPYTTKTYKAFHTRIPIPNGVYPPSLRQEKCKTNPIFNRTTISPCTTKTYSPLSLIHRQ